MPYHVEPLDDGATVADAEATSISGEAKHTDLYQITRKSISSFQPSQWSFVIVRSVSRSAWSDNIDIASSVLRSQFEDSR